MANIPNPINSEERTIVQKVCEISGENVYKCMQCGTCSAVCPMVESMEITTREGIHLLQLGCATRVLEAKIGEFCASCLACQVRCPREIDVAKVYEAVRQVALRKNVDLIKPESIPKETMGKAPQIAFVSGFRKLTS
jgi:heterodisulfide reductase subunit C